MHEDVKNYIDTRFDELEKKIDNIHSLLEKIRNNEVRTLMYSQLNARLLNYYMYIDQIKSSSYMSSVPVYEQVATDEKFKKAHYMTKVVAEDLKDLVVKKSKGRKDLLEDKFTNSLAFISGIDETLL